MTEKVSRQYWSGRRVFLTGHTGFKGSWLGLWLSELGANVLGVSHEPKARPYLSGHIRLSEFMSELTIDVCDSKAIQNCIREFQPTDVFHLAAQPLVLSSYQDPVGTWQTNVVGTQNVLEACRRVDSVKTILVATTDKVYENKEWPWGYRESDPLGGHDPYSASKAATEILCSSYERSFFRSSGCVLNTARAGNVFGGGDGGEYRIIPDIVRASQSNKQIELRNPKSVRPWQFVLEALRGYIILSQAMGARDSGIAGEAFNFGPQQQDTLEVFDLCQRFIGAFDERVKISVPDLPSKLHEAGLLRLDTSKAFERLGWTPLLSLNESLELTARWYKIALEGGTDSLLQETKTQIQRMSG